MRDAIEPCWNVDPGRLRDTEVVVRVRVEMRQDLSVISAQLIDPQYPGDPIWASAARSALRAVQNGRCQPWPLPQNRWPDWQVIEFTFDPREMF